MTFISIIGLGLLFLAVCMALFLPILWFIHYVEECTWALTKSRHDLGYQQDLRSELLALKDIEQRQLDLVNQEQRRVYEQSCRDLAEQIQRDRRA